MIKSKFRQGDKVGIKLDIVKKKIEKENYLNIEKFDKRYNKVHIVSNIYQRLTNKNIIEYRYELDNEFVFYKDELFFI